MKESAAALQTNIRNIKIDLNERLPLQKISLASYQNIYKGLYTLCHCFTPVQNGHSLWCQVGCMCVCVCVRALLHVWMCGKRTYTHIHTHAFPEPWRQSRYTCKPWFASIVLVKCFPTTGIYVIVVFPHHIQFLFI